MKILLSILLIFLFNNSNGQSLQNSNCLTLSNIIEMPIFNKQFYFLENQMEAFIVVDTSKFFSKCNFDSIQGRIVKLIDAPPTKIQMRNNNNIVFVSIGYKFENRLISFGFWCPGNGTTLSIFYELKDKELYLLGYKTGDL